MTAPVNPHVLLPGTVRASMREREREGEREREREGDGK